MKKYNYNVVSLNEIGLLNNEKREIDHCTDDEVVVKVMRCGVCGSDIGRVFKSGTYNFPTVIGHEFSGIVDFDNENRLTGERVTIFPLLPCFKCESCKNENYACCDDYDYYGSRRDGGFSQYLKIKKFNLVKLPDNVSYDEGAMTEPTSVGYHAVKKLGDVAGKNILISGGGTIGIIAGRILLHNKANKVIYIENDTKKIDFLHKNGFSVYQGEKIDMAIEGTGVDEVLAMVIKSVKPSGRIVLMGNPSKELTLSAKNYQIILRKELNIVGTWNSSYSEKYNDWKNALNLLSKGSIVISDLITHHFSLKEAACGLDMMLNKKEFFVKVMIDCDK